MSGKLSLTARIIRRLAPAAAGAAVAAATGGAIIAASAAVAPQRCGEPRTIPTGVGAPPGDEIVAPPVPPAPVEPSQPATVEPAPVELEDFGDFEFDHYSEDDSYVTVDMADGDAEPPVVIHNTPRLSRAFRRFITLGVGIAAGTPMAIVIARRVDRTRRDAQGTVPEVLEPSDSDDMPDSSDGPGVPPAPHPEGRTVVLCPLHNYYYEAVAFCPYCDHDGKGNEGHVCVPFENVPEEWRDVVGRLIPKIVFSKYQLGDHYYLLVGDVLHCNCGRHKKRTFKACKIKPDLVPFHIEFRLFIDSTILLKDDAGNYIGFPVFSSYGYLEGYSASVL